MMRCQHSAVLHKNAHGALELIRQELLGQWISDYCQACGEEVWITYVNEHAFSFMVAAVRCRGEGMTMIDPDFLTEHQMRLLAKSQVKERERG